MNWLVTEQKREVETTRTLPLVGLLGADPTPLGGDELIWITTPAGAATLHYVAVRGRVMLADAAEAERLAEAIAAEWPIFVQHVADRVAAAKAKEAAQ